VRSGNRKKMIKKVYKAFVVFKFKFKIAPLLFFLEMIDVIKPVFLLRNYKVRRTMIQQYPAIVSKSLLYGLATR